MDMVFEGKHLRVLSPRTIDGVTPLLVNDTLQYKEEFLPLSAKPFLERQNKDLPEILRKKIEVIDGSQDSAAAKAKEKQPVKQK